MKQLKRNEANAKTFNKVKNMYSKPVDIQI